MPQDGQLAQKEQEKEKTPYNFVSAVVMFTYHLAKFVIEVGGEKLIWNFDRNEMIPNTREKRFKDGEYEKEFWDVVKYYLDREGTVVQALEIDVLDPPFHFYSEDFDVNYEIEVEHKLKANEVLIKGDRAHLLLQSFVDIENILKLEMYFINCIEIESVFELPLATSAEVLIRKFLYFSLDDIKKWNNIVVKDSFRGSYDQVIRFLDKILLDDRDVGLKVVVENESVYNIFSDAVEQTCEIGPEWQKVKYNFLCAQREMANSKMLIVYKNLKRHLVIKVVKKGSQGQGYVLSKGQSNIMEAIVPHLSLKKRLELEKRCTFDFMPFPIHFEDVFINFDHKFIYIRELLSHTFNDTYLNFRFKSSDSIEHLTIYGGSKDDTFPKTQIKNLTLRNREQFSWFFFYELRDNVLDTLTVNSRNVLHLDADLVKNAKEIIIIDELENTKNPAISRVPTSSDEPDAKRQREE